MPGAGGCAAGCEAVVAAFGVATGGVAVGVVAAGVGGGVAATFGALGAFALGVAAGAGSAAPVVTIGESLPISFAEIPALESSAVEA